MRGVVCIVSQDLVNLSLRQSAGEVEAVIQHPCRDIPVVEDHSKLQGLPNWSEEIIAVTTFEIALPMNCGFRAHLASPENLKRVKFTTAG